MPVEETSSIISVVCCVATRTYLYHTLSRNATICGQPDVIAGCAPCAAVSPLSPWLPGRQTCFEGDSIQVDTSICNSTRCGASHRCTTETHIDVRNTGRTHYTSRARSQCIENWNTKPEHMYNVPVYHSVGNITRFALPSFSCGTNTCVILAAARHAHDAGRFDTCLGTVVGRRAHVRLAGPFPTLEPRL